MPLSSRRFGIPDEALHHLTAEDRGFRIAERVRHILIKEARPAVVLVNALRVVAAFERSHARALQSAIYRASK